VGSGTALVEASVMGVRSLGVDIDPLAVAIARAKLSLLHAGEETMEAIVEVLRRLESDTRAPMRCACVPPFLTRRLPADVVHAVETDVGACLASLSDCPWCSPLHIALSDAIARKFKFRFVGLGYARFSLSVARQSVRAMFVKNLRWLARSCAVWQWLRAQSGVRLAPATVLHGDARNLPFGDSSVQAIVTSPPYMPASSGRESYLRSKACSLIALGLMDAETIDATEHAQMGTVVGACQIDDCPPEARELVTWLETNPSRRVKAQPTARYFADLQRALSEMARVLETGGRCAVVVAGRHVFYQYRTREVVRVVQNAEIVAQMGVRAGLELTHTVPVELRKRNAVARPRARDSYAETVLEFRKRDESIWMTRKHAS
jgi:SAM-dependent methyltransferase